MTGGYLICEVSVFVSGTTFDSAAATRSGITKIYRESRNPFRFFFLPDRGSPMLSDVRQAALEFRTEIGRFGRDLDGKPADSRPSRPRNENRFIVILSPSFWGLGMPGKKFPSPETLKAQTLFSVSPLADVVCPLPSKIAE